MTESSKPHKSGFVSIVGKPNSGKSTLINRLMGQPIAGVSSKPQTTRKRQLGILTSEDAQIIFTDTPGLHEAKDKLSNFINTEVSYALHDADLILFLVDGSQKPDTLDVQLAKMLDELRSDIPVLLVLNKNDNADSQTLAINRQTYESLLPGINSHSISGQTGNGVKLLVDKVTEMLPEGPQYYPPEQITEVFERDIAAELIRAACFTLLQEEVPYSIAVKTNEYSERDAQTVYINATIYVERDAQKAIVIGKGGDMIKRIGTLARQDIQAMNGQKVYLDLTVKVQKDWKNNASFLNAMGLSTKG